MKKVLIITTFLFFTLSLSADVWQRCEFVDEASVLGLFEFDNGLYLTNISNNKSCYKYNEGKWEQVKSGIFSSVGQISTFSQNKNVS